MTDDQKKPPPKPPSSALRRTHRDFSSLKTSPHGVPVIRKPESWDDLRTNVGDGPAIPRTISVEQTAIDIDDRTKRNLNVSVDALEISALTFDDVRAMQLHLERLDRDLSDLGLRVNSKLDAFVIALIKERETEVEIQAKTKIHAMDIETKNTDAIIEEQRKQRDHRRWLVVKFVGLLLLLVGVYVAGGKGPSL